MQLQNNQIIYSDHVVSLDPALHASMPEYLAEMADTLSANGSAQQHDEELDFMNNDGSWTITPR